MWRLVLMLLGLAVVNTDDDTGAEYLKSVIDKLHNERVQPSTMLGLDRKITGPTPVPLDEMEPEVSAAEQHEPIPQPLSKEELAALYQAALSKGAMLDLAGIKSGTVQGIQALQNLLSGFGANKQPTAEEQGYYYYFYPIKSFDNQNNDKVNEVKPLQQMAQMVPTAMMILDTGTNKGVEPLFMAIAGFVGMALMFAFSVLFMPKFGNLRSRGISALKQAPDELAALTTLVLDGIDGKDCTERIACELGRAVRKMQLDKKPIRILQLLLPPALSKQVQLVRQAAAKKEKCNFIPCKWKRATGL